MTESIYNLKLSIIGNSGCGKTTMLKCFVDSIIRNDKELYYFDPNIHTTIGIDFFKKTLHFIDHNDSNVIVNLKIFDTAGQERFRTVITGFYRDANGIILVFDLNDINSFNSLESWLNNIYSIISSKYIVIILVGTKSDLLNNSNHIITDEMIYDFCQKHKLQYIETSSKENKNITFLFEMLAKNIISKINMPDYDIIDKSKASIPIKIINKNSNSYYLSCCK